MAQWPDIASVLPASVDRNSVHIVADLVLDQRTLDDMPRYRHIDLDHPAVTTVPNSVPIAVALVRDNHTSDIALVGSADNKNLAGTAPHMWEDLEPKAAITVLNSDHTAGALVVDNPNSDITPGDMVANTAPSVDLVPCTEVDSVHKAVIMARSSVRIVADSVADNHNSDIMWVDTVVSTATSVGPVHNVDISSALIAVVHTLVRETAIAAPNLALAR